MPRRNENVRPKRGVYRPPASEALERIEAKRKRLDVTMVELARRANVSERTMRRMMREGRAFRRHVAALTFALRTIERERQAEAGAMPT